MAEGSTNIALFGLVGALVATLPGLLGVLFGWVKSRDEITRALKNIELTKAEVDLLSTWIKTVSLVSDGDELQTRKNSARDRLDLLMDFINKDSGIIKASLKPVHSPLPRKKSFGFYAYSGFIFFILWGFSLDENNEFTLSHFKEEMTSFDGVLTMMILVIIWIVLFVRRIWLVSSSA